jgi:hypothetical protein
MKLSASILAVAAFVVAVAAVIAVPASAFAASTKPSPPSCAARMAQQQQGRRSASVLLRAAAEAQVVEAAATAAATGVPAARSEPDADVRDVEIPTNLPSACGMDYIPLATMLATGQLAEADQVRMRRDGGDGRTDNTERRGYIELKNDNGRERVLRNRSSHLLFVCACVRVRACDAAVTGMVCAACVRGNHHFKRRRRDDQQHGCSWGFCFLFCRTFGHVSILGVFVCTLALYLCFSVIYSFFLTRSIALCFVFPYISASLGSSSYFLFFLSVSAAAAAVAVCTKPLRTTIFLSSRAMPSLKFPVPRPRGGTLCTLPT